VFESKIGRLFTIKIRKKIYKTIIKTLGMTKFRLMIIDLSKYHTGVGGKTV